MTNQLIFENNLTKIANNYDYFILDIWGVIHDGNQTYPGVLGQLKYLKSLNKRVCFLSNAPRRSYKVQEALEKLGITKDLYDFIITSGEATYLFLQKNYGKNIREIPTDNHYKYYYIGPEKDADLLNGLKYEATNAEQASFVVNTGFDHDLSTIEEKLPQLIEAKKYNLPMICVNPDLIVVRQSGHEMICAGTLASRYQQMGGEVVYFGKPFKLVYDQVLELFSIKDKTKVLAVGDGIETDIAGANNNEIDSALIAGAILAKELNIKHGELPNPNLMKEICQKYKAYPKFIIGSL